MILAQLRRQMMVTEITGSCDPSNNLIRIPGGKGSLHAKISGYYSSKQPISEGQTVRKWISTKSFEEQYEFGIKTLKKFGW